MASLMHIYLPNNDNEQAQHFVDQYLRANRWNVDAIKLEEEYIEVKYTKSEAAIYKHHENMTGEKKNGKKGLKTNALARESLLRFCSHFSPDGEETNTKSVIDNLKGKNFQKQREWKEKLRKAERERGPHLARQELAQRFRAFATHHRARNLGITSEDADGIFVHSDIQKIENLLIKWDGGLEQEALQELVTEVRRVKGRYHNFGNLFNNFMFQNQRFCQACREFRQGGGLQAGTTRILRDLNAQINTYESKLRELQGNITFFDNAIASAMNQQPEEERECNICLEDMEPKDILMTRCGHYYHAACLRGAIRANPLKLCPDCRTPVQLDECLGYEALQLHSAEKKKPVEDKFQISKFDP